MPATFTHSPAETERKEPGIGGRPPLIGARPAAVAEVVTTTGGIERRGPRELLHRIRFFVSSALPVT